MHLNSPIKHFHCAATSLLIVEGLQFVLKDTKHIRRSTFEAYDDECNTQSRELRKHLRTFVFSRGKKENEVIACDSIQLLCQ